MPYFLASHTNNESHNDTHKVFLLNQEIYQQIYDQVDIQSNPNSSISYKKVCHTFWRAINSSVERKKLVDTIIHTLNNMPIEELCRGVKALHELVNKEFEKTYQADDYLTSVKLYALMPILLNLGIVTSYKPLGKLNLVTRYSLSLQMQTELNQKYEKPLTIDQQYCWLSLQFEQYEKSFKELFNEISTNSVNWLLFYEILQIKKNNFDVNQEINKIKFQLTLPFSQNLQTQSPALSAEKFNTLLSELAIFFEQLTKSLKQLYASNSPEKEEIFKKILKIKNMENKKMDVYAEECNKLKQDLITAQQKKENIIKAYMHSTAIDKWYKKISDYSSESKHAPYWGDKDKKKKKNAFSSTSKDALLKKNVVMNLVIALTTQLNGCDISTIAQQHMLLEPELNRYLTGPLLEKMVGAGILEHVPEDSIFCGNYRLRSTFLHEIEKWQIASASLLLRNHPANGKPNVEYESKIEIANDNMHKRKRDDQQEQQYLAQLKAQQPQQPQQLLSDLFIALEDQQMTTDDLNNVLGESLKARSNLDSLKNLFGNLRKIYPTSLSLFSEEKDDNVETNKRHKISSISTKQSALNKYNQNK